MAVEIIEQEPMTLYALHHQGRREDIDATWRELWRWILDRDLESLVRLAVGVCRCASGEDGCVAYDAGMVFKSPPPSAEGVAIVNIVGGRYASYRLIGPYTGIPEAFGRLLREWLPESGFEVDERPTLEIYRNNPYTTPALELATDLLIPVRRRAMDV